MAVTTVRGVRTTDLVSSSLAKRDVYEAIYNIDPYQTPITQFFLANKTAKYAVGNPKFELQEDVLVPHSDIITTALSGGSTTETGLTPTNVGYFKVGDVIRNTTADENYRVTAVSTTIDLQKVGSGNITATAANWTALIIGSAFAEATTSAQALSTQGTFPYNYAQIFKKSVNMSGTQMATVNYGGNDWAHQREKATKEFKNDLERMWMFGVRGLDTTSGANIWYSGGFIDQTSGAVGITDRTQYVGTDFASEDVFFNTYCKNLFAKGSNSKVLYCGADAILKINDFSKVKQQTKVADTEYGINIETILTPFGRAQLQWHPFLEGAYSNWVFGLDRNDYLKYAFLSGNGVSRDMMYQTEIQTPDDDERKDQYLAQVGLHLAGGSQGIHRTLYPGA